MTTNEQDSIQYGDILVPGAGKNYWPWLVQPNGLEIFFKGSGMEKYPNHLAPEHFPRPKDVLDIEKNTAFWLPLKDP
jgi:hypothetical protein